MIRFFIKNGRNSLRFDAPTDELFDHLGSIGINEDIRIGGTDKITVEYYPTESDDNIAEFICGRLLPDDKISDVNKLCRSINGQWLISEEEFEREFTKQDLHGAAKMFDVFEKMNIDELDRQLEARNQLFRSIIEQKNAQDGNDQNNDLKM